MSEDLTKNLPQSNDERLTLVLTTVQALVRKFDNFEQSVNAKFHNVNISLSQLHDGQQDLEEGQQGLHESQRSLQENYQSLHAGQLSLQQGYQSLEEGQRGLREGQRRLETQLKGIDGRLHRLEEGQEALRMDFRSLRRSVDHRFLVLSGTVLDRHSELEKRVTRLELGQNPPNTQT